MKFYINKKKNKSISCLNLNTKRVDPKDFFSSTDCRRKLIAVTKPILERARLPITRLEETDTRAIKQRTNDSENSRSGTKELYNTNKCWRLHSLKIIFFRSSRKTLNKILCVAKSTVFRAKKEVNEIIGLMNIILAYNLS